jgi:hypothetical protein
MKNLRTVAWLAILLASVASLRAQAIAPPIAEYRGNAVSGMVEVQNSMDYPMVALIETRGFTVDGQGQVHYGPMDPGIRLSLGATSFLVGPHDTHMVFYKATTPVPPVSFAIVITMTRAKAAEGMRINFVLPHMVYVYQKDKLNRADVKVDLADGVLHIQNTSQKLGRVTGVRGSKQEFGGFPLYPGQTREMALAGNKATVNFEDGFRVDVK